jgi:alanine racemase
MTVRLSVRSTMWRSHIARVAATVEGLVPVVKGNGYGFGRTWLAEFAADFSDTIAVGNVHELAGMPSTVDCVVLTPTLTAPEATTPILTVGSAAHVEALAGWGGRVLVKLTSTMRRFGRGVELIELARDSGLAVVGASIHPPLAGSMDEHAADVVATAERVPGDLPIWVSHLDPETHATLPRSHRYRLRLGTLLWHGDKSTLHLESDVLDVRPVRAGERAGYRSLPVGSDGHLVVIGAGTANGVTPLPDGRSPFHHARRRLPLHEAPHMHVSMTFVADGEPLPAVGEWVDVQRPLHMTTVDEYRWR